MIIWIASYPKSGNTYIRSFLSAYYFSSDGKFNFDLLKNIKQFPERNFFEKKMETLEEAAKNYIICQEKICSNKKAKFLKTHNLLGILKGYPFTKPELTLGVIYIVRDPRSVVKSLMNHYSFNEKKALEFLIDKTRDIHFDKNDFSSYSFLGNWTNHYNSWTKSKKYRKLIIKYEDLENNTYETFRDIIVFTNTLLNRTERVDKEKLNIAIETTDFKLLKKIEEKEGFIEAATNAKGEKKVFFNEGFKNNWEGKIKKENIEIIEEKFYNEMVELEYLKK